MALPAVKPLPRKPSVGSCQLPGDHRSVLGPRTALAAWPRRPHSEDTGYPHPRAPLWQSLTYSVTPPPRPRPSVRGASGGLWAPRAQCPARRDPLLPRGPGLGAVWLVPRGDGRPVGVGSGGFSCPGRFPCLLIPPPEPARALPASPPTRHSGSRALPLGGLCQRAHCHLRRLLPGCYSPGPGSMSQRENP